MRDLRSFFDTGRSSFSVNAGGFLMFSSSPRMTFFINKE